MISNTNCLRHNSREIIYSCKSYTDNILQVYSNLLNKSCNNLTFDIVLINTGCHTICDISIIDTLVYLNCHFDLEINVTSNNPDIVCLSSDDIKLKGGELLNSNLSSLGPNKSCKLLLEFIISKYDNCTGNPFNLNICSNDLIINGVVKNVCNGYIDQYLMPINIQTNICD